MNDPATEVAGRPASATAAQDAYPLFQALRGQRAPHTPVWFMRQAGRSLPEYRAIRERHAFLEVCGTPELAAEVTLQPVRSLGVDAAIIFADIMTPLLATGVQVDLVENVGPVIREPVTEDSAPSVAAALRQDLDVQVLAETIGIVRQELDRDYHVPLIGFAGAPFTIACYLVEGRGSRDFPAAKRLMYSSPLTWQELMDALVDMTVCYLKAQVAAGAQVVQLFDTWAGILAPGDYVRFVRPYSGRILAQIEELGVPIVHFTTGTSGYVDLVAAAGGTALGVDWRIALDEAWESIAHDRPIQGNLDPLALLAPWEVVRPEAEAVLRRAGGRAGHIFNLGHGVHPQTPVETLRRLADFVHSFVP